MISDFSGKNISGVIHPWENFPGRWGGAVFLGAKCPRGNYAGNKQSERQFSLGAIGQGDIVRGLLSSRHSSEGQLSRGQLSGRQFSSGAIVSTPFNNFSRKASKNSKKDNPGGVSFRKVFKTKGCKFTEKNSMVDVFVEFWDIFPETLFCRTPDKSCFWKQVGPCRAQPQYY